MAEEAFDKWLREAFPTPLARAWRYPGQFREGKDRLLPLLDAAAAAFRFLAAVALAERFRLAATKGEAVPDDDTKILLSGQEISDGGWKDLAVALTSKNQQSVTGLEKWLWSEFRGKKVTGRLADLVKDRNGVVHRDTARGEEGAKEFCADYSEQLRALFHSLTWMTQFPLVRADRAGKKGKGFKGDLRLARGDVSSVKHGEWEDRAGRRLQSARVVVPAFPEARRQQLLTDRGARRGGVSGCPGRASFLGEWRLELRLGSAPIPTHLA